MSQDMTVPCGSGIINIRVGAIILKNGRFLMVGNSRSDYLYSVGGRLKFGERNGGACVHDDDMKAILEEILACDLLVWSFPLYCYGMPASLKALLDRTLPLSSMAMRKVGDRYEHVEQADFSKLKYSGYEFRALKRAAGRTQR